MIVQDSNNAEDNNPSSAIARRLLSVPPSLLVCPLFLTAFRFEPVTKTKMVSVAIVLPPDVGAVEFSLRVMEGARELQLTIQWPTALINLQMLHKKWIESLGPNRMEEYYPTILGFEGLLKKFRNQNNHYVESSARFPLPFPV